jgi:hypothetical protein
LTTSQGSWKQPDRCERTYGTRLGEARAQAGVPDPARTVVGELVESKRAVLLALEGFVQRFADQR